jgi:predicted PurR-regulated permease PerM
VFSKMGAEGLEKLLDLGQQFGVLGIMLAIAIYFLAKSEIRITYLRRNKAGSTPYEAENE